MKEQESHNRSITTKLFFRSSGRPKKLIRKLLFRRSGKPHRVFRFLVLTKEGEPNKHFKAWMESTDYLSSLKSRENTSNSPWKTFSFFSKRISKDTTATEAIETLNKKISNLKFSFGGLSQSIMGLHKCNTRQEHEVRQIKLALHSSFIQSDDKTIDLYKEIAERLKWIEVDNNNIRDRMEFVRKEIMFELRKHLKITNPLNNTGVVVDSKILNPQALSAKVKRLNLGCGHIPKSDYINVDARELPGVDLISDVSCLPFEPNSISEIFAAHLIEYFSERSLEDIIFPHWKKSLEPGGVLVLIAPNTKEMIDIYKKGDIPFSQLKEIIFGGQEYDGDFHFTMFSPESLIEILYRVGFDQVDIIEENRLNGACIEFEIKATK